MALRFRWLLAASLLPACSGPDVTAGTDEMPPRPDAAGKADGTFEAPQVLRLSAAHTGPDGTTIRSMVLPGGIPLVARYQDQSPRFTLLRTGSYSTSSNSNPSPIPLHADVAMRVDEPERFVAATNTGGAMYLGTYELGVDEKLDRTHIGSGVGRPMIALSPDTAYVAWVKRVYQPGPDAYRIEVATCPDQTDCTVQTVYEEVADGSGHLGLVDFIVHEGEPIVAYDDGTWGGDWHVVRQHGGTWSSMGSVPSGEGYRDEVLHSAPGRLVMVSADTAYEWDGAQWQAFAELPALLSSPYSNYAPDDYWVALTSHGLTILARKHTATLWRESEGFLPRDVSDTEGILGSDGRAWSIGYPYALANPPAPTEGQPLVAYDATTRGLPVDSPIPCTAGATLTGTIELPADADAIRPGTCIVGATIEVDGAAELIGTPEAPIMLLDSSISAWDGDVELDHVWIRDGSVVAQGLSAEHTVLQSTHLQLPAQSMSLRHSAVVDDGGLALLVYPEPGATLTLHDVEVHAAAILNSRASDALLEEPIEVDVDGLYFVPREQSDAGPMVEEGVIVLRHAGGTIANATIVGGPSHGIVLHDSDLFEIHDSVVGENAGHGILVDSRIPADLTECVPKSGPSQIDPNWVRTLYWQAPDPVVANSTIRDNGGSGIEVTYPFIPMSVYGNRIERNAGEGFAIREGVGRSGGPCETREDVGYCCYAVAEVELPMAEDTFVSDNVFAHNGAQIDPDHDLFSDHRLGVLDLTDNCWTHAVELAVECTGTCDTTATMPPC